MQIQTDMMPSETPADAPNEYIPEVPSAGSSSDDIIQECSKRNIFISEAVYVLYGVLPAGNGTCPAIRHESMGTGRRRAADLCPSWT